MEQVCSWYDVVIEEISVQPDHIRLVCSIPPKYSVSKIVSIVKGNTAVQIFSKQNYLKEKP
ncbi:transposase [Flavivirga rizhaonensis]|uniref:transposase n=1 Tax=Flavivirga rizhaonensis TaxID=2559571 RepID=UPI0034DB4DF0